MALAPVFAPMIGGVLQSAFGWRSHFVLQIAFGLIAALFVWRKLPETLRAQTPGPFSLGGIWAGYREIMRRNTTSAPSEVRISRNRSFATLSSRSV